MTILLVISAALFATIGAYIDKHIVNLGISKKDYFYYMCLSMIPFSVIMLIVEIMTGQFRFDMAVIPIILLIVAMVLRYVKQKTIVGCLTYLNPYEDSAYLTLGIILAFIIDVLLGMEKLEVTSIVSVILTIVGAFLVANAKLKIKNLRIDLFFRIITVLALGYVTHYILIYWSNAMFILLLNVILTLIFCKDYSLKYNKKHSKFIKWCFVQQIFGFAMTYLTNILIGKSVMLSNYVKPVSIAMILLIALTFKDKKKRPTLRQAVGVLLVVSGIALIG